MADIPRPDKFVNFPQWLGAVLLIPGMQQKTLAEVAGITPTSVNQWKSGRTKPGRRSIKKMAAWGGFDHVALQALVDEEPIPGTRRARAEVTLRRNPEVEAIAVMLDTITGDEASIRQARVLVQEIVNQSRQQNAGKKKQQA